MQSPTTRLKQLLSTRVKTTPAFSIGLAILATGLTVIFAVLIANFFLPRAYPSPDPGPQTPTTPYTATGAILSALNATPLPPHLPPSKTPHRTQIKANFEHAPTTPPNPLAKKTPLNAILRPSEATQDAQDTQDREANLVPDDELISPAERKALDDLAAKLPPLAVSPLASLPAEVDLRHYASPVKRQDNGKCSAFGLLAALEHIINKQTHSTKTDLSEWHAWSYYQKYSASRCIHALNKHTVALEKDWPQYAKKPTRLQGRARLAKYTYLGTDATHLPSAIAAGRPVYLAMKTPKEMLACNKFVTFNSLPANGGHAVLIEGYVMNGDKGPVGYVKNSWGTGCGDRGYQYLDMRLCKKKGFYCYLWSVDAVEFDGVILGIDTPDPAPSTPSLPTPPPAVNKKCTRLWYAPWVTRCK